MDHTWIDQKKTLIGQLDEDKLKKDYSKNIATHPSEEIGEI